MDDRRLQLNHNVCSRYLRKVQYSKYDLSSTTSPVSVTILQGLPLSDHVFRFAWKQHHRSSAAGDGLAGLQVTSGSALTTEAGPRQAAVWRLTAARPADMFPGEDNLTSTLNNKQDRETWSWYVLILIFGILLCQWGPFTWGALAGWGRGWLLDRTGVVA